MLKQGYTAYKFAKAFKHYKNSDNEAEKVKSAKLLTNFFEQEGGIFLKIAQYLGTKKDEAQEIQQLSNRNAEVLSQNLYKEILEKSLNKDLDEVFELIEEKAYSASIGQVQKGILKTGDEVAIKVQYPNIREKIYEQLKLLSLIPTSMPEKRWGVNVTQYKEMIKDLVENELDYNFERERNQLALDKFKKYEFIKIPKVYDDLSCENVLVTEFIEAANCEDILNWSGAEKRELATNLFKSLIAMLYEGFFQADTNHGNFLFSKRDLNIVLIDYGQFKNLSPSFSKSLLSLIYNISLDKKINYGAYFLTLGFEESKLYRIENSLEILAKIIFEPFTKNSAYSLNSWEYKKKIDLCLGEDKWWFRSAGGEEFFLVMKAFMGIKNLIDKLEIKINWQNEFLKFISPFEDELQSFNPPNPRNLHRTEEFMGNAIKVQIKEKGQRKVELKLPIDTLYDLRENIGDDVLPKLLMKGIDIESIAREAIRNGAKPQKLFEFEDEITSKEYFVQII